MTGCATCRETESRCGETSSPCGIRGSWPARSQRARLKPIVRKWGTGLLNVEACRIGWRHPGNVVLSHGPDCGAACVPGCPIEDLRQQGVAHYFYQARTERPRNDHPTAKPTELMRYLCRLVTPKGGVVLDPFCGSGSTGVAAVQEGLRFVGVEREPKYAEIACQRLRDVGALRARCA